MTKEVSYDVNDIKVLDGLDHVRLRPGMYIGGADKYGFHHLLEEILNNSIDEAINGHASEIVVCLDKSMKKISVEDNGRGIPTDIHPDKGISTVELVLTSLHSGGKFGDGGYKKSGGLHGVGSSVVNALSSYLYVKVQRSGQIFEQEFERGKPKYSLRSIGSSKKTGTFVEFTPDYQIFGDIDFDEEQIKQVLEAKSYLHSGIKFVFKFKESELVFYSTNGLFELVSNIVKSNKTEVTHGNPMSFVTKDAGNDVEIDLALCWTDDTNSVSKCYANGIFNSFGGTHESGFKDGVIRSIRSYMTKHDISIKGIKITPEDMREGLYFVISVFLTDPEFQAQTKDKLLNSYIKNIVSNFVYEKLESYLLTNPDAANLIITRIIQAAKARSASRAASEKVSRKKVSRDFVILPGKLADCESTDITENEIFVVEGASAAGGAKQSRDRKTQAILSLRGKILNTEMATKEQALKNKEIDDIIKAIGCGHGSNFNIKNLRYGKIILLMDADYDGLHIATLMLTFFYRYMPELIKQGHIYVAQPPLYKIEWGKDKFWAQTDEERERIVSSIKKKSKNANVSIQRFKGLGEMMPETLFETTLDPKNRILYQIQIPASKSIKIEQMISGLLGKDNSMRQQIIFDKPITLSELYD